MIGDEVSKDAVTLVWLRGVFFPFVFAFSMFGIFYDSNWFLCGDYDRGGFFY